MSRREREAKDAAAAKERYKKLHAQGKTDEAKADLARLAVIRKEREEKAKQRQAGRYFLSPLSPYICLCFRGFARA